MNLSRTLKNTLDRFMGGRGEASIAVPILDGPLKPNDHLESAKNVVSLEGIDNLAISGASLLMSAGNKIWRLGKRDKLELHSEHEAQVTCIATGPNGIIAVGLAQIGVKLIEGSNGDRTFASKDGISLNCPTSIMLDGDGSLYVTNGSSTFSPGEWQHDLLHLGNTGCVVRIDCSNGTLSKIAEGLKFPAGICASQADADCLIVSEAWSHRLITLHKHERRPPEALLSGLPAYPARIVSCADGGYLLSAFAVRSQLQEFILREHKYRRQMLAEVEPKYWIAPSLSSGHSFMEPLQAGGVIRLGIHKPWAPTRSYGLAIKLNEDALPISSVHSRAGGARHGIMSAVEFGDRIFLASKGKGVLLSMPSSQFAADSVLPDHGVAG